ncbi:hypothetical protein [Pedobacter xixiisoli]|uniref:Uncharacterized protein n=1 Tax=Pedobacter xixiisoli TaxID=1476464 RepID=A0A286A8U8_9SPHI|nr:hypothetical protein [Pedobacter xixiisoli]SOD18334.1 hypothetical protein SAMN06297358_2947 [Pedobacter xixiisoli]
MKKSDGKWASIMALITTLFSPACNSRDRILERNEKPLSAAYANFQELDEKYKSEDFEVKLICEAEGYPNPIHVFPSVNKQWIIRADAGKDEETKNDMIFYKLNSDGNLTDTIFTPYKGHWPELIGNFMIFTSAKDSYYNTWPLDGDTTKQTFKVLNTDLAWSAEKVEKQIKDAKLTAAYWFLKDVRENRAHYVQFYYYQDKQWQMLWQKLPGYHNVKDNETAARYTEEAFRTGEYNSYLPENVSFLHFHPLEKLSYRHNIGGGDPGFSTINWRGKAFFSTKIDGKDFLFFEPNVSVENERFDGNKNRFYSISGPGASSNIFTPFFYTVPNSYAFYTSNRNKLYLIKKKTT